MRELLFIYGTLLDRDLFRFVTGRPLNTFHPRPYALAGWRVAIVRSVPFPALVTAQGADARGLIIGPLDKASMQRLKRYEGVQFELKELRRLGAGERLSAFLPRGGLEALAGTWRIEDWRTRHKAATMAAIRANPWLKPGGNP